MLVDARRATVEQLLSEGRDRQDAIQNAQKRGRKGFVCVARARVSVRACNSSGRGRVQWYATARLCIGGCGMSVDVYGMLLQTHIQ